MPATPVEPIPRDLEWVGSSLDDLRSMPIDVRRSFGYTLSALQMHAVPAGDIKRLAGFDSVLEIRKSFGDAYRLVYLTVYQGKIYVLHAFKKKSHKGSKTPREEMNRIRVRLQEAHRLHDEGDRDE